MAGEKSRIIHKHFRLDAVKLKRAQKVLEARTETETVERALELAIAEHERIFRGIAAGDADAAAKAMSDHLLRADSLYAVLTEKP